MEDYPEYHIKRELGSGCFGYVFEAEDVRTKQRVAIKRIEKVGKQLSREYEILNEIRGSPHCVHMLDCFYTKAKNDKLVQNLVFEFLSSNLEDIIKSHRKKKQKVRVALTEAFAAAREADRAAAVQGALLPALEEHRAPGPQARECAAGQQGRDQDLRLRLLEVHRREGQEHALHRVAVLQVA